MTIELKQSELSAPGFTPEQISVLRKLADTINSQTITQVQAAALLSLLNDVSIPNPADKDVLSYDSAELKWIARDPSTPVTVIAGTTHTLVPENSYSYLRTTNGSAVTITISPQADQDWLDYAQVEVEQGGIGQVTIAAGSGVTLNKAVTFENKTRERYSVVGLKRTAEDVWTLFGDLEEVELV